MFSFSLYHYKHGSFRLLRASNAGDILDSLMNYVCTFSKYADSVWEEILFCFLQDLWKCTLINEPNHLSECSISLRNEERKKKKWHAPLQTWIKVAGSEEILRQLIMLSTTWDEKQQRYKLSVLLPGSFLPSQCFQFYYTWDHILKLSSNSCFITIFFLG